MRLKFLGILSLALLSLTGCSDENAFSDKGTGKVNVSISADNSVMPSIQTARAVSGSTAMPIQAADMSLRISGNNGKFDRTWAKFGDYDPSLQFAVGKYTVEAFYGALTKEGFDSPYYYGSTDVQVYDSETAKPVIEATLANTMVKVSYTAAFKSYFTDYTTTIHSSGGNAVTFVKDEARAAYVRPGDISIDMTLTKTTGVSFSFSPAAIQGAKPKTLYNVTFDVNGGNVGDAVLTITFDETTVAEPIEIDLSDKLIQSPAPVLTAKGFVSGTVINVLEGDVPSSPVSVVGVAYSGLKSVTLSTQSAYLASRNFPAEVDLMALTPDNKSFLEAQGLEVKGLWSNPDKTFLIKFDNFIKNLKAQGGDGNHSFTLQVKDIYTKISETVVLKLVSSPVMLSFTPAERLVLGQTSLLLNVDYNGSDIANNVKFSAYNAYGAKIDCPITEVNPVMAASNKYQVRITVPDNGEDLKIMASYKDVVTAGGEVLVRRNGVTVPEGDVYSYSAEFSMQMTDKSALSQLVNSAQIEVKTSGGVYAPATISSKDPSSGRIAVSGLTPGTAYTAKLTASDSSGEFVEEVNFTTEGTPMVPNGDFELVTPTIDIQNIQQGGQWTSGMQWLKYTYTNYNVSEPTGWASVNAKTCCPSAQNQNTWFVSPSTYNSAFKGVSAQNGSNAMVLRNVGWDLNGSTPGLSTNGTGAPYSKNAASVANRAAGKLFIGTYSFDSNSLVETYTEGVDFAARPTKLSGFYMYVQDSQDNAETGTVEVSLLSSGVVIATGRVELAPAGSYTQFDVNLVYSDTSKKATQLKIMISSSNHSSYTIAEENNSIKTTNYMSEAEQITRGAQLTVDNLTFSYK